MGVVVTLEVAGRSVSLPDPAGGDFNAAGDFDRLLPFGEATPLLRRLAEYGEVVFAGGDLAELAEELNRVISTAVEGPERNGLRRLQALARHGSEITGATLRAIGD